MTLLLNQDDSTYPRRDSADFRWRRLRLQASVSFREIPKGVWRDITLRLISLHGDFSYLIGEVKRTIDLVEVHSFEAWDHSADAMVQPRAKSTAA
jgi:hypothetical protein